MAKKHNSVIKGDAQAMAEAAKSIVIEQPTVNAVALEIVGTAPLIMNNFSQKALEQMLRKHMGLSVQKEAKKPREVIEGAIIRNVDGKISLPPTGFKKAMLTASTQLKTFKKTQLRLSMFVEGNSIPITFAVMVPRMDMVRTAGINRAPDIRFRPMFEAWKARVVIQFSAELLTVQTVVDLLQRAGRVGMCEWRPEKDGTFGTFKVSRAITNPEEIAEVRDECTPHLRSLRIPEWALDAEIDPTVLQRVFDEQDEGATTGEEQQEETGT